MAAILDSLGFTFLIDRMTEVLTPDIYRAHCFQLVKISSKEEISKEEISSKMEALAGSPVIIQLSGWHRTALWERK